MPELLLEEELALGLADALELAGLDLRSAEDLAAAEIGVEELALALQLALQHVHWLALGSRCSCGGDRDRAVRRVVCSGKELRIVKNGAVVVGRRRRGVWKVRVGCGAGAGRGGELELSASCANLLDSREIRMRVEQKVVLG